MISSSSSHRDAVQTVGGGGKLSAFDEWTLERNIGGSTRGRCDISMELEQRIFDGIAKDRSYFWRPKVEYGTYLIYFWLYAVWQRYIVKNWGLGPVALPHLQDELRISRPSTPMFFLLNLCLVPLAPRFLTRGECSNHDWVWPSPAALLAVLYYHRQYEKIKSGLEHLLALRFWHDVQSVAWSWSLNVPGETKQQNGSFVICELRPPHDLLNVNGRIHA